MLLREYQTDILETTRTAFRSGYTRPLIVLPPGAGKTVCFAHMAYLHVQQPDRYVWFLVHRRELVKQARDTFTELGLNDTHIFVGMVQTISRHPERYQIPTLIIFDEAHHATANSWHKIVDYFQGVPMVGLTATPARLNGDALGMIFDRLIEGVSAQWLIDNQYLAPFDYYAPKTADIKTVTMRGADFNQDEVAEVLMKSQIYGDILKYIDITRKTIIYAPSIKFSKYLESVIPGAVHFDGTTPTAERDRIVREFKIGHIRILINCDLIGEGFDVPDCDTVMLVRPTQSVTLYIQQSMRCMRYLPGKRAIIYDFVGNAYRHGLPTDDREWSLTGRTHTQNKSGEPDITARQCGKCYRVYSGIKPICPYCGYDNGQTRAEIKADTEAELVKIEKAEKIEKKRKQGMASSYEQLVKLGYERNYKMPEAWARNIIKSRGRKL